MNHVFIGLGGTGGRIVYALRRAICQHYPGAGGEPRQRLPDGSFGEPHVRVGFLYVDSHPDELNAKHDYLGEPITLDPARRLLIRQGNLADVVRNEANLPNITPWLGRRDRLDGVVAGGGGTPGASQLRRVGRFLFATHVMAFRQRVQEVMDRVRSGTANEAHFHLCGTLAGGTGSGSIVDAAMQIRNLYPDTNHFKIYLYALITEDNDGGEDAGWFYPNQYAALKEINALATGLYRPHDISGAGGRMQVDGPVTACVLVSNVNRARVRSSDVALQEQLTGDWLFQRTIGTRGRIPAGFDRAWTLENIIEVNPGEDPASPEELANCGDAARPGLARSYRFSTIGIKRWAIPEEEIREKLVFTLGRSAVLQMAYAHWATRAGYLDTPSNRKAPEGWLPTANNTAWELTDDLICLNTQAGQSTFDVVWQRHGELVANRLRTEEKNRRDQWLSLAEHEFEKFWERGFRDTGVSSFFAAHGKLIDQRADELVRRIEMAMLDYWRAGHCGLHDLGDWLGQIGAELLAREQRLSEIRRQHEDNRLAQEARQQRLRQQWRKLGWVTKPCFSSGLLRSWVDTLAKVHRERTWLAARGYQEALLRELRGRVAAMEDAVKQFQARLLQLASRLDEEASARCVPRQQDFSSDLLVREFAVDEVHAIAAALTSGESFQERFAGRTRDAVLRTLPGSAALGALTQVNVDDLRSRIEQIASEAADAEHTTLTHNGTLTPVLNVSILEKLRRRFQGDRASLQRHIHDLLRGATTSVELSVGQAPPTTHGDQAAPPSMPHTQFAVFLPQPENERDPFYLELRQLFEGGVPGNASAEVRLLEGWRPQEITVMAVDYWMAARFLAPLRKLRARYEATLAHSGDEAKLRMHLEDVAAELPDLFKPERHLLRPAHAWRFLGTRLGFLQEENGSGKVFAVVLDDAGRPARVPIEIASSWDAFFRGEIESRLARAREALRETWEKASAERRSSLRDQFAAALEEETSKLHLASTGNALAPAYREWLEVKGEIDSLWREVTR